MANKPFANKADILGITNPNNPISGNPMSIEATNPKMIIPIAIGFPHALLVAIRSNLLLLRILFF